MIFFDPEQGPFSPNTSPPSQTPPSSPKLKSWQWWLTISLLSLFILSGQATATLLGRFYYNCGGKSLWMSAIVQSAGAPLLLPIYLLRSSPATTSFAKLATTYICLGLLIAGDNLMYSYGLLYLPVSTYSQKFTPFIFNSILLLTIAAALLGVQPEDGLISNGKYPLGFVLTVGASAAFSLIMSLMQLSFEKVLRAETFLVVMHMILWTNFVAAAASVAGLFGSGEWRGIGLEFVEFEKGKVSYVMTLVWIAVSWVVYSVGTVGLIFVASSLFSNVIATLGLPLVPVFAVVFFRDRMDGVKVVALVIAGLGFANYLYQHYLDDLREKKSGERGDVLEER